MKLSIDVNDEELSKIIENGIKGLSNETITEIAKNAVSEFLSDPKVICSLVFEKLSYCNVPDYDKPRNWFLNLLKNSFSSDEIKEYSQKFLSILDENKSQIIINALALAFSESLLDSDLKTMIYRSFSEINR